MGCLVANPRAAHFPHADNFGHVSYRKPIYFECTASISPVVKLTCAAYARNMRSAFTDMRRM